MVVVADELFVGFDHTLLYYFRFMSFRRSLHLSRCSSFFFDLFRGRSGEGSHMFG